MSVSSVAHPVSAQYPSESPKVSSLSEIAKKVSYYVLSALLGAAIGTGVALAITGAVVASPILLIGAGAGAAIGLIAKGLYDLFKAHHQKPVMIPNKLQVVAELIEEQFQEGQESLTLSNEQLDQILDVSDQMRRELTHHNQVEQLRQRLESKIEPEKTKEVLANAEMVPSQIHDPRSMIDDEIIDSIVQTADNYYHNQLVLDQLKHEFASDAASLETALSQIGMADFTKGKKRLTEEMKEQIVGLVRKMQANEKFDDLLASVKACAARGDVLLDEKEIEKRFQVSSVLQPLSEAEQVERRKKLQVIVNQAYVNRELKLTTKWTVSLENEIFLLKGLGFDVKSESKYYNRDLVYQTLTDIVQQQMQADGFTGSVVQAKQKMQKCALQARLKMAGVESLSQVNKFGKALPTLKSAQEEIKDTHVKEVPLSLPDATPPLAKSYLTARFNRLKAEAVSMYLRYCIGKIKSDFTNEALSTETFVENFAQKLKLNAEDKNKLISKCQRNLNDEKIKEQVEFFSKWGPNLKREMIQGFEDEQEIFGDGICYALCIRLMGKSHPNPQASAEEIAKLVSIQPTDRFFQAFYGTGSQLRNNTARQFPPQLVKKLGFKEEKTLFELTYDGQENDLEKRLKGASAKLEASNGWVGITVTMTNGHHAIAMRLDSKNNRVWLFDPNAGFFAFEQEGKTFEESREKGLECLKDLLRVYYPSTYNIDVAQLIK